MLQRSHGQLLRDFHFKNLREIHAQRVCIPRGADVVHQVSLQPLCTKWCCTFLTCVFEFRCFETNSCEAPLTLRGRGQTGDRNVRLPKTNSRSRHGEAGMERTRSGKSRTFCSPDTATMGRPNMVRGSIGDTSGQRDVRLCLTLFFTQSTSESLQWSSALCQMRLLSRCLWRLTA